MRVTPEVKVSFLIFSDHAAHSLSYDDSLTACSFNAVSICDHKKYIYIYIFISK